MIQYNYRNVIPHSHRLFLFKGSKSYEGHIVRDSNFEDHIKIQLTRKNIVTNHPGMALASRTLNILDINWEWTVYKYLT